MDSDQVGSMTEAKIIHRLLSLDYSVSTPFGGKERYDLLVDTKKEIYKVQCKTATLREQGVICFSTSSRNKKDGEYFNRNYKEEEIDAFVAYSDYLDECYWVWFEEAAKSEMSLRFESKIDHPKINWCEDFKINKAL